MPAPTIRATSPRVRQEAVAGGLYGYLGSLLGTAGACVAFFGAYVTAINSTGWVIGLALGWVTAWLAAVVAFITLRRLWPLLVVLLFALLQ